VSETEPTIAARWVDSEHKQGASLRVIFEEGIGVKSRIARRQRVVGAPVEGAVSPEIQVGPVL